jgi:hypothetical protein
MYSKKEQLKWNKPPKEISKEDKAYLEWFANTNLACIVCNTLNGVQGHHIKERSTDKKNHKQMLPLCLEHHTGNKISPHGAKKQFFEMFPIEAQIIIGNLIYEQYLEQING